MTGITEQERIEVLTENAKNDIIHNETFIDNNWIYGSSALSNTRKRIARNYFEAEYCEELELL